jgi:glycosyltransferase involved in cell wall biosynthesis
MGDHVIAISEDLHRDLLQKGIRTDRLSLVPAGVDAALFENKDPNVMRSRYKIGSRPLVVYTGTLDTFQRIDLLLIAMRLVIDKIPEAMLLIAGNIIRASDLAQFSDLARELGIAPNVIFTDERPLEEMPYFLASADVAVAPRPSCPGFPIKLLNYMAAAKPIVVFHGSAKGLQNMQNAIVVPDQDSQEYGRAILTILQDPPLALALGSNARQTVQRTFDWPTLARKIERIYAELGP